MVSNRQENLLNKFYSDLNKKTREFCEKEKDQRENKLEPFEVYCARQEQQTAETAKSYINDCTHACQVIIGELSASHDYQTIQEFIQGAERFTDTVSYAEEEEKTLREAFGYSNDLMEKVLRNIEEKKVRVEI